METTIAAISTAYSPSGIGIVRLSGPEAFAIASSLFFQKGKAVDVSRFATHTLHHGGLYEEGQMIDDVLLTVMKAPRTYTGEDTVEINCHGGLLALRSALEAVLHHGAVMAEPGEFTKRAFLNGRMDLSQAEAVMDVIEAKGEEALSSSLMQLKGSLAGEVKRVRSGLIYQMATIESALDDPEHISLEGFTDGLSRLIREDKEKLEDLINTFEDGKFIREGIQTVILGRPNAGKSSLLNLLLDEEKAIVTDIAGTTRDMLDDYIHVDGMSLHLIDTAGLRKTQDVIETIGVQKALEISDKADLILYVIDSSLPMDQDDRDNIAKIKNDKNILIIYNKNDLISSVTIDEVEKQFQLPVISISAKDTSCKEKIFAAIREMFFQKKVSYNSEVVVTNIRHKICLEKALESLSLVQEAIDNEMPEDILCIDLFDACDQLGQITGETAKEDLVNEIFSKFCIGK